MRHATEEQPWQAGAVAGADDDQIDVIVLSGRDNGQSGIICAQTFLAVTGDTPSVCNTAAAIQHSAGVLDEDDLCLDDINVLGAGECFEISGL